MWGAAIWWLATLAEAKEQQWWFAWGFGDSFVRLNASSRAPALGQGAEEVLGARHPYLTRSCVLVPIATQ